MVSENCQATQEPTNVFLRAVPKVERHTPPSTLVLGQQRGGAVSLDLQCPILPYKSIKILFRVVLSLLLWVTPGLSQKTPPEDSSLPKYELDAEMKTKGAIDEVNLVTVGKRKDFTELIIKNGDDKIHIYVCPKPFEDEMGINFSKGDQITVTGSKAKYEGADVILARELVKGEDTLLFRDAKGTPVWDARTGK
jgi:hypothetical protein